MRLLSEPPRGLLRDSNRTARMRLAIVRTLFALLAFVVLPKTGHADEPALKLESVVVTGSAIRSSDVGVENPVTVISRSEIEASSATTLQQLLSYVSASGFQGLTSNQNSLGTANGTGNEFADLRNLGSARTLVLVDGKRLTPSGNITFEGVDLGAIPLSLIDHVEVLRDGASPIYGSDAIAGVINIILRKRFDGVEVGAAGGLTGRGDGASRTFDATWGHVDERSSVTASLQYGKTDPIDQRDREWARNRVVDIEPNGTLTTTRNPGGIAIFNSPGFKDPVSDATSTRWIADGGGLYHRYTAADRFDLSTGNQLTIGQERVDASVLGALRLSSDIEAYGQAFFDDRTSRTRKNGATLGTTPVTLKYPNGFLVPASAPGNPFGLPLTLSKVFEQVGDQAGEARSRNGRALVGLRGTLGDGFAYDASYSYGRVHGTFKVDNAVNFTHAEQEVGQVPCSAADVAAGCGPGNMFGPSSLSASALDYLRYTSRSQSTYTQHAIETSITGDLLPLPAGPLAIATGATARRLSGSFTPDAVTLAGDQQGADAAPTSGAYTVAEIFAETKAPLLRNLPFAREVDVTLASRFSHYSNFGSDVTWKGGVDWRVDDSFRFRLSGSTGVRAPSISELHLGKTSVSNAFNDPCDATAGQRSNPVVDANCAAQGLPKNFAQPTNNYNTLLGGNPDLKPERSKNWSLGMVLTPAAVRDVSASIDYWNIAIRDSIGALNPTTILQTCYASPGLSDPLCGLIGPRGGVLGNLTTLTDLEANQGTTRTDGLDVNVRVAANLASFGWPDAGSITLQSGTTWTFSHRQQLTSGGPFVQLVGTVDQPTSSTNPGAIPRVKSNAVIGWSRDAVGLTWTTRYIGPVHALGQNESLVDNRSASVTYFDTAATWRIGRLLLVAGVDNLLDRRPPFYDDGTVNTSEYTYDLRGRFVYLKVRARF